MTTCRATGSDPNDYFLIHLRILIRAVMACLLWWVEGEVEQQKKKKKKWTICSQHGLTHPAGGDRSAAGFSCRPMGGRLNPSTPNFETILTNSIIPEPILPSRLLKQTNKAGVPQLQLI